MVLALLSAFAIIVVLNCAYFFFFANYAFSKPTPAVSSSLPVSVIVCCKNEAENLKNNIPLWLEQNHTDFELILINDASIDDTLDIMETFAAQDSRIKIVNVVNNEAFWANKKYALTLGIKKAKNHYFIFTDADCKPASKIWVNQMASHFSEEKQLILGYGAYAKASGLLNTLIRFETFLTALQYFSFAKAGIPYMGVGRNLAYTSKLFYDNNGFMSHMYIRSGDDDLFVNEVATKQNTAICDTPESFTISTPKKTWKSWINQKKRHITTSAHYKISHKILLGLFYLITILFWTGSIVSLFFVNWKWIVALAAFRFLIQYIIYHKALTKLQETGILILLPFLELALISSQMLIFISNLFSKPKHWK
tara:strand:+ start:20800 stop:21897 length:1098 start_codon:yes stop_codon:yes gene_type:complete